MATSAIAIRIMPSGFIDFEFDLPTALLNGLVSALDRLKEAPLDAIHVDGIPNAQGVYQIFIDDKMVYIGKTDADAGLHARLKRHSYKIQHRIGLNPSRVSFKAIRIYVFTAMDLETQLIRHYSADGKTDWNGSGFGANDPGRNRDFSQPGTFDSDFPIDIDCVLDADFSIYDTVAQVAALVKSVVPYTFRFETGPGRSRFPHSEMNDALITLPATPLTARQVIERIVDALPSGWQATALSSLLILYKEHNDRYPKAQIIARS